MSDENDYVSLDPDKSGEPATKYDLLKLMMRTQINALLTETALFALASDDRDLFRKKMAQLEDAGKELSGDIRALRQEISKGVDGHGD